MLCHNKTNCITVTGQLNRSCLLTVTWTVGLLLRRVADARDAAGHTQHWGRVCLPPRQCASTSRSWQLSFCAVRHASSSVLTFGQPTVVI